MKSSGLCPRLSVLLLALTLLATACSQKMMRQVSRAAGEEAALATLQGFLVSNNITSADHMVDAMRLVVEKKDYAGAAAAFAVALDEHNVRGADKISSSQVIALMRKAVPTVKKASPRVASYVTNFCSYVEKQK